jgi:hypothetical protein
VSDQERSAGQFLGASAYGQAQRPIQPTPEEIAEWRKKEEEQRKAYNEQQRKQARAELLDSFAMAALTGLLAAGDHHAYNRDEMAIEAWRQADAMLKARGDE